MKVTREYGNTRKMIMMGNISEMLPPSIAHVPAG